VAATLRAWNQPSGGPSLYQTVLILHVARAHNAAAGVVVLTERGFGELAMSVGRQYNPPRTARTYWLEVLLKVLRT